MPSKKDNISKFNKYLNSDEMPYIVYTDPGRANISEKSSTKKLSEHISCGYMGF